MKAIAGWWQQVTGEDDNPLDGDSAALVVSLFFHIGLLVLLGLIPLLMKPQPTKLSILTALAEEEAEELRVPEEFQQADVPADQVGAHSSADVGMAVSLAPVVAEMSEVPSPVEIKPVDEARIEINHAIDAARGLHVDNELVVRGAAGEGVTGAIGAVDRITKEILTSMEERKTLVVWLFDQSGSLHRQRQQIHDRIDRVYRELGVIEAAKNPAFAEIDDKPLLSSVVAFGDRVTLRTERPTDDVAEIKAAIRGIEMDDSGVERVFSALYMAADAYKKYRVPKPDRNVMLVVFTDEAGEDQQGLDDTVSICRRYSIPVYVVGAPAPFGRDETLVKWVDPDPSFDQSPQWGRVSQGPETLFPERLRIGFASLGIDDNPMDSGFGPFALTRICYETGGIFFAVHPNRNVNRAVNRRETAAFSSHLTHFFDSEVMRSYRPDYVSAKEYQRGTKRNKARAALVQAASLSWVTPIESPRLEFIKRDEAALATDLTEAQKGAAQLEPVIRHLYETLKIGEPDRTQEFSPRWQAGYDLAMGRVLALVVRTESYNAMLAKAKRGMKFKGEKNNTWLLRPSDEISVGSQLENMGNRARDYLERVVDEHPGTPWALIAQQELSNPFGWTWDEEFTNLAPPPRPGNNNNNNNNARPNNPRPPQPIRPPKRKVPKL